MSGQVLPGLVGLAEIEQPGDDVQPVGELVLLGRKALVRPVTAFMTTKAGVDPAKTTRRGVGAGTTFIAAMKQKAIDCGMPTEPTVSKALSDGTAIILLDMRTATGSRAALGGTDEFVRAAQPLS